MTLTAAQVRRQQRRARRELEADYKRKAKAKLAELRARVKSAKRERRTKLKHASSVCRSVRRKVGPRAREIRAAHTAAAKAEIEALRMNARTTCTTRRARAARKAADSVQRAGAALDAEQKYQGSIERYARKPRLSKLDVQRAARERSHESDDEVANNLPEELLPVWRARAPKTKPTDRATRTEVFLDWVHNHSAQAQRIIAADIDQQIAELVREEREHRRRSKRPTKRELAQLEAAPF